MNFSQFKAPAKKFSFKNFDSADTGNFKNEAEAHESIEKDAAALAKYQDILMAHETYGLVVIFQGMDSAGKDSIIKHVMSPLDPQGCETKMFKAPTEKELRHDYLWRVVRTLPARGQIGIFNRSYYENVTTDRVHPEKLDKWTLPAEAKGAQMWRRMYKEINNFEQYLFDNGIHVLKFFFNMSKEKQRENLLERLKLTEKKWKFSMDDIEDRALWDKHLKYYEEAISHTSTRNSPWYIIPDDHRWYAKATAAAIIAEKLKSFHSQYPRMAQEQQRKIKKAQEILEREGENGL
jgi:PPK2 family polyphosphate:nucleotide phosphotransferase